MILEDSRELIRIYRELNLGMREIMRIAKSSEDIELVKRVNWVWHICDNLGDLIDRYKV